RLRSAEIDVRPLGRTPANLLLVGRRPPCHERGVVDGAARDRRVEELRRVRLCAAYKNVLPGIGLVDLPDREDFVVRASNLERRWISGRPRDRRGELALCVGLRASDQARKRIVVRIGLPGLCSEILFRCTGAQVERRVVDLRDDDRGLARPKWLARAEEITRLPGVRGIDGRNTYAGRRLLRGFGDEPRGGFC